MTVEEIFKELSAHMIKGVMIHTQLKDYYDFLNLHGYKRCHEYHGRLEMKNLNRLHKYYINHYNKLIPEMPIENPAVIPNDWYAHTRQDVDVNTKRNAVKNATEMWVKWETDTKDLFQRMYQELMTLGEVATANKMACYVCDVDRELKWATRKHLELKTADYNIDFIMGEQDRLHDWYKAKMA